MNQTNTESKSEGDETRTVLVDERLVVGLDGVHIGHTIALGVQVKLAVATRIREGNHGRDRILDIKRSKKIKRSRDQSINRSIDQ